MPDSAYHWIESSTAGTPVWLRWASWRSLLVLALFLGFGASSHVAWGLRPISNFPQKVGGRVDYAPAVADLSGDGRPEIVAGAGRRLIVLTALGQALEGFPLKLDAQLAGAPALSASKGKRPGLVLLITRRGSVLAIDHRAQAVKGFPYALRGKASAGGLIADLDGDGARDAIFASKSGVIHAISLEGAQVGEELPGFPTKLRKSLSGAPAIADLGEATRKKVLLIGGMDGILNAINSDGKVQTSFRPRSKFEIAGGASSADLNGNGQAEVAFTSGDFGIYLVNGRGELRSNFPVMTEYRIKSGPALADLDGDGFPEIIVASGDGRLYALTSSGHRVEGFPSKKGGPFEGGAVVGDLNGDGHQQIVAVRKNGEIVVVDSHGVKMAGWQGKAKAEVSATPCLSDINGDGQLEILVADKAGWIEVFTGRGAGKGVAAWGQEGQVAARGGWLHPTPTRFLQLSLQPKRPTHRHRLKASYQARDLDRDGTPKPVLRWLRNGSWVPEAGASERLPAKLARKHEHWSFDLRDLRDPDTVPRVSSSSVEILNTPPSPPGVLLVPSSPRTGQALTLKLVQKASDEDGEALHVVSRWWRDGNLYARPEGSLAIPAGVIRKGEVWSVDLRASDDESQSPQVSAAVTIMNTPPAQAKVRLGPKAPKVTDTVRALSKLPAQDVDGDRLQARYLWRLDGRALELPWGQDHLPAGVARKGQRVQVTLVVEDGESQSPSSEAELVIQNSIPTAPTLGFVPKSPKTGDALSVRVLESATDADHEPLEQRIRWWRDGEPTQFTSPSLPKSEVHRGQVWKVEVIAFDGEQAGPAGNASVTVGDLPPGAPVISITPAQPRPGAALSAKVIVPASDPDGDPLTLSWRWLLKAKSQGSAQTLQAGRTQRDQRWVVEATASDGTMTSRVARASVTIINRPPPSPRVPASLVKLPAGAPFKVRATLPADPDGDKVRLRSQWRRDGQVVSKLEDSDHVAAKVLKHWEHWQLWLWSDDGSLRSKATRITLQILDRAPLPAVVELGPSKPDTDTALVCSLKAPVRDPDGDKVSVTFRWKRGAKVLPWIGPSLDPGLTHQGERYRCYALVRSGAFEVRGKDSATIKILNAAPRVGRIEIEPSAAKTSDDLHCGLTRPFSDPDHTELEYSYRWERVASGGPGLNERRKTGRAAKSGIDGPQLASRYTRRGERWRCGVRASDKSAYSPEVEAFTVIENSPPTRPELRLDPPTPRSDRPLRCVIVARAHDPDRDSLQYRFRWYREGKLQAFSSNSVAVPVRLLKAGDSWRCGVVGYDGALEGAEGRSERKKIASPTP